VRPWTASTSGYGAGFTVIEAVISTIIVAIMLVAALGTVGASRLVQQETSLADRGRLLAESLLAEIMQQQYQDPNEPVVFGSEADEATATRVDFDDVDDYHGWSAGPPVAKDGTALTIAPGWTRNVAVVWVDPQNPATIETTESGVKRITVTARCNNVTHATLVALRTDHQ
jgi:type II secretory pathway pseudopilin PulG